MILAKLATKSLTMFPEQNVQSSSVFYCQALTQVNIIILWCNVVSTLFPSVIHLQAKSYFNMNEDISSILPPSWVPSWYCQLYQLCIHCCRSRGLISSTNSVLVTVPWGLVSPQLVQDRISQKYRKKIYNKNFHEKEHKHLVEAGLSLSFTIFGIAHLVTFLRHPDILLLHFTMGRYEWEGWHLLL